MYPGDFCDSISNRRTDLSLQFLKLLSQVNLQLKLQLIDCMQQATSHLTRVISMNWLGYLRKFLVFHLLLLSNIESKEF